MDASLLKFLLDNFGINLVKVVIVAFAILFIINSWPKIIDSFGYFQSRKIKHMNEALNSDWVSNDHKKILRKDVSALYIFGTLKIKVSEKDTREIIKLSNRTDGRFSTIELHHAINKIGYDFYNLPLADLESKKTSLKKSQILDRIIIFMLCIIPVLTLCILGNTELSWNKYHLLIFGVLLSFLVEVIRCTIMLLKEKENGVKVLSYLIRSSQID